MILQRKFGAGHRRAKSHWQESGRSFSRKLAAEGALVIALDVRADESEENALAARSEGLEMAFGRLNVTEPDSWSQCLEACQFSLWAA
jgi:NAD(P)-dependent dehydrogenase (short-subunit alcohol dehydrogenase family)